MEAKILLQSLIDNRQQPFLVADRNYRVVAINRAFESVFHISRKTAIGQHCFTVSRNYNRPCFELGHNCPMDQMLGAKTLDYQSVPLHIRIYRKDDSSLRAEFEHFPLEDVEGNVYVAEALSIPMGRTSDGASQMVGNSPVFRDLMDELQLAAKSQAPVLLTGETGTGKELAARYIHDNSVRREKPFLVLDCTVLSESLFESEVFGHKRGSFTGSVGDRQGLIELAQGGTLLLDEIGEIPAALQPKLLRLLDSSEYRRVGETQIRQADVRICGATNRDLAHSSVFRRDLYYRIACTTIIMPPLCARLEDIPELTRTLLERIGASEGKCYQVESDALELLQRYTFPGNIRELRNILWDAASRSPTSLLRTEHVSEALNTLRKPSAIDKDTSIDERQDTTDPVTNARDSRKLRDHEREQVAFALQRHKGNRRRTAHELGISERTLYRKLSRYQL